MPVYALIIWIAIGAMVGWSAQRLLGMAGSPGLMGDIIVGILGAVIGGYLLGLLGASGAVGIFVSLLTALVGAVLLLWAYGKVIKR